ncbi:hypothetical protein J7L48_11300 [bacterium]|nr:hypothetical protein [bacterium]
MKTKKVVHERPVRMQNINFKMERIINNKPVGAVREPPASKENNAMKNNKPVGAVREPPA